MTSSYSPVLTTKAVKDETEQRILREAHVRHQCALKCASPLQNGHMTSSRINRLCPIRPQDSELINLAVWTFNVRLAGEGCRSRHAAADVSGGGGAGGKGVGALGCRIRQPASQVSSAWTVRRWGKEVVTGMRDVECKTFLQQSERQQRAELCNHLCEWTQRRPGSLQVQWHYTPLIFHSRDKYVQTCLYLYIHKLY